MNAQLAQVETATCWAAKDPKNQRILDAVCQCLKAGEARAGGHRPQRSLHQGERVFGDGDGVDL